MSDSKKKMLNMVLHLSTSDHACETLTDFLMELCNDIQALKESSGKIQKKEEKKEKLKTLEEHNAERYAVDKKLNSGASRLNGIACPECGAELYDTRPMVVLTSYPPQKNIHCSMCTFTGYRVQ